jgi:hypothetical protein
VYVDFDDVLCETALEFTRVLEHEFGKHVAFGDIFTFDLGRAFGLTPDEIGRLMRLTHEPDILLRMEPVPGAVEALARWSDAGHDVWVVTGRPAYTHEASAQWLSDHGVPYAELRFVDKYARASDASFRHEMLSLDKLAGLEFCLAVEDAPKMVQFLAQQTRTPVAALRRPWNVTGVDIAADAAARIFWCDGWPQILARFPLPGGV